MKTQRQIILEATTFFTDNLKSVISKINEESLFNIKEFRIKRGYPVLIRMGANSKILKSEGNLTENLNDINIFKINDIQFDEMVKRLFNFSMHTYQDQMKNGYITVMGGHRVGICASAVVNKDGEIVSIKNISSLSVRVSREVIGSADELYEMVFKNGVKSLIIAGEVSSGKTTLLRDLSRKLSSKEFDFLRVSILDQRGEIASMYNGINQNTLGVSCDVFDAYPKAEGMMTALKTMSPDVIVCDEIGEDSDIKAIKSVVNSGVKIISTIHASSFEELKKRKQFVEIYNTSAFDYVVVLEGKDKPCKIKEIVSLRGENEWY